MVLQTTGGTIHSNYGGGVFASHFSGDFPIISSTIADNGTTSGDPGPAGKNLYHSSVGGSVTLTNTIVAKPYSGAPAGGGANCLGTITSGGFNLDYTPTVANQGSCVAAAGTNLITNPLLGSLADNGGPTKTMALLAGSPALDKGTAAAASTDQRGLTRPSDDDLIADADDGSDIGAFELQVPDTDGDGVSDNAYNGDADDNPGQANDDGDGEGDACDGDDDNDGLSDGPDDCETGDNGWTSSGATDDDADGCRDAGEDLDDDNDGVGDGPDDCETGDRRLDRQRRGTAARTRAKISTTTTTQS